MFVWWRQKQTTTLDICLLSDGVQFWQSENSINNKWDFIKPGLLAHCSTTWKFQAVCQFYGSEIENYIW